MRFQIAFIGSLIAVIGSLIVAGSAYGQTVQAELNALAARAPGVMGACLGTKNGVACVNGDRAFPLQSVVKLPLGLAVYDLAERGLLSLDEKILIHRQDRSVFHQPLADNIGPEGFTTTLDDLVIRAITQSDNTACDILFARIGGPATVQGFLRAKHINGIRVDRTEKDLQSEIHGLSWQADYADPDRFEAAIDAQSEAVLDRAYQAYRQDPRDRATPKAMAELLAALAQGRLLGPVMTKRMIALMETTRTATDRLRAGTPAGYRLANKTGTSSSWKGITAATNDMGLLFTPDGTFRVVVGFLADGTGTAEQRAAILADLARIAAKP